MLALVYNFDNFRSSMVGCKIVVYTIHKTIRNLYNKNDEKLRADYVDYDIAGVWHGDQG